MSEPAAAKMRLGAVEMDDERHEVREHGRLVALAPMEYRLLRRLLERPGYLLSRDALLEDVWDGRDIDDMRTVDVHICKLRAKIPSLADRIETVRGFGYRAA